MARKLRLTVELPLTGDSMKDHAAKSVVMPAFEELKKTLEAGPVKPTLFEVRDVNVREPAPKGEPEALPVAGRERVHGESPAAAKAPELGKPHQHKG